jgi:restriction system protein
MGRRNGGLEKLFVGVIKGTIKAAVNIEKANRKAAIDSEIINRRNIAAELRNQKAIERSIELEKRQNLRDQKLKHEHEMLLFAYEQTNESNNLYNYFKFDVLVEVLDLDLKVKFDSLKPEYNKPDNLLPESFLDEIPEPIKEEYFKVIGVKPLFSFIPSIKLKWVKKNEEIKNKYEIDLLNYENAISERDKKLEIARNEYLINLDSYEKEYKSKCDEIEEFKRNYYILEKEAVISFVELVLESSDYFVNWGVDFDVTYSPDSKEILIEYKLPVIDIIPHKTDYKYIKLLDSIEGKNRKKTDIETCYKSLIASIAIRTIYEVLCTDAADAIDIISFNGYVNSINPVNGREINPILVSVLISKEKFNTINLRNISPIECLKGMSALISPNIDELAAVKPIREYFMIDKRFVKDTDILSQITYSPNLMDLDPFEFENLVSNLFTKMGLETKQTRTTRDGGVDAIAFDTRPIIGGKLVIQAKRYKNTVGVSAVRDLYGTMLNEGASKGILVTTSTYGTAAYEFAKDKPIELIDGGGLLYLLKQVDIAAKIIMPDSLI